MFITEYECREDCKNLEESHGEICVMCNRCDRFTSETDRIDELVEEMWEEERERMELLQKVCRVNVPEGSGLLGRTN